MYIQDSKPAGLNMKRLSPSRIEDKIILRSPLTSRNINDFEMDAYFNEWIELI